MAANETDIERLIDAHDATATIAGSPLVQQVDEFVVPVQISYPAQLEIKPGDINEVNLNSKGNLPVALLSDVDFDATTMDLTTITLGNDDGSDTPIAMKKNGTYQASFEDVNGDGLMDLMMHFGSQALISNGDLDENTTELKFNGHTEGGLHVIGEDTVIVL